MRPRRNWRINFFTKSQTQMNSGPVAYRYAKALLKYVQESGYGDKVYSQVCSLVHVMEELPQLADVMTSSDISVDMKISLMTTALGEDADPAVVNFLKLVSTNRRQDYFLRILLAFVDQYRHANNIMVGSLVTAVEIDGLKESLEVMLGQKTSAQVYLDSSVNPEILGGFIFELDGCRLDASVEGKLAQVRRQLVEPNNRIV